MWFSAAAAAKSLHSCPTLCDPGCGKGDGGMQRGRKDTGSPGPPREKSRGHKGFSVLPVELEDAGILEKILETDPIKL